MNQPIQPIGWKQEKECEVCHLWPYQMDRWTHPRTSVKMTSSSSFSMLAASVSSPRPGSSLSNWDGKVNEGGVVTATTSAASLGEEGLEGSGNSTSKTADAAEYFYQVEQLTFLWVLFTMIVIGNATVLIALMLSKGRKSRMNFFIKNLAAADLFVGLISVLTDIIWKITISWEAGLVACKMIRFLQGVVTYASTYVLVALSIDRYDAITHPMNFSGSWRRARGLVAAAWMLSFVFSAPLLHFYNTKETKDYGTQCWINFTENWQWQVYMTLVSLTIFVIPAILIAGCYIVIVCTIWNKGREMSVGAGAEAAGAAGAAMLPNGRPADRTVTTAGGQVISLRAKVSKTNGSQSQNNGSRPAVGRQRDGHEEIESRRASSRGLIPKAKVKTVKMTFVIIFVFILCWSPYIGFDLLQVRVGGRVNVNKQLPLITLPPFFPPRCTTASQTTRPVGQLLPLSRAWPLWTRPPTLSFTVCSPPTLASNCAIYSAAGGSQPTSPLEWQLPLTPPSQPPPQWATTAMGQGGLCQPQSQMSAAPVSPGLYATWTQQGGSSWQLLAWNRMMPSTATQLWNLLTRSSL